ncbi:MAG: amidoligase family protein [Cellulosilyticum sp.]|nr:amidoligase family protein [Cellulosilyticum sp.]
MKTQRFGIEIEFTGITREQAATCIQNQLQGSAISYIGGTYDAYHVIETTDRIWKIVSDSSIEAQRKRGKEIICATSQYKVELVSPILTYEDIEPLQEMIRALRTSGAFTNKSCGIHIHIDASPHTPLTLKNLVNLMASKEDLLYKALEIDPQRLRYCKKVNEELITAINKKKPKTIEQLADLWYQGYGWESRTRHYHQSRYHGLNLHSTFTKGTVEFRLFNSTLHAGKVKAYIQFCLALSNQALTQKTASAKRTHTDNEKYTFRCWMLRLGLNGDEFKTCRLHFLANLTGNSAWRNAA